MMMKSINNFVFVFLVFLYVSVENTVGLVGEDSPGSIAFKSNLRHTAVRRHMFSIGWSDYWDDVKSGATAVSSGVESAAGDVVDTTKDVTGDVVQGVSTGAQVVAGGVESAASDVADFTKDVTGDVVQGVSTGVQVVSNGVESAAGDVVDVTKDVTGDVVQGVSTGAQVVSNGVESAAGDVVDVTKDVTGDVIQGVSTGAQAVASGVESAAGDVVDVTKDVAGDVMDVTKNVADDVVKVTKTVVGDLVCGNWGNVFFQDLDQFAANKGCVYGLDIAACAATGGVGCVEEVAGASAGAIIEKLVAGSDTAAITDTINVFLEKLGESLGITIPTCITGFIITQITGGDITDPASLICTIVQDCLCSAKCGC